MNKELRIKETPEQKVYFTSDTHFNHNKDFIYEARGYSCSEAHTDAIICSINKTVRENDILFHLGDFCLNTTEGQFNELLTRIRCQNIYHLWGNHNGSVWQTYQREVRKCMETTCTSFELDAEVYPFRYRNMVFLGNYAEVVVNGHKFILFHYPIYVFNYMKNGTNHLCGHSHGHLDFSDEKNLSTKTLDIGWDDFGKVLSLDDVLTIMNKKSIFEPGDHHQRTKPSKEKRQVNNEPDGWEGDLINQL